MSRAAASIAQILRGMQSRSLRAHRRTHTAHRHPRDTRASAKSDRTRARERGPLRGHRKAGLHAFHVVANRVRADAENGVTSPRQEFVAVLRAHQHAHRPRRWPIPPAGGPSLCTQQAWPDCSYFASAVESRIMARMRISASSCAGPMAGTMFSRKNLQRLQSCQVIPDRQGWQNPSMPQTIVSPLTTRPTFSGVPEKMMSPGGVRWLPKSLEICSATFQII